MLRPRAGATRRLAHVVGRRTGLRQPPPHSALPFLRDADAGVTDYREVIGEERRDLSADEQPLPFNLEDEGLFRFPAAYVATLEDGRVAAHAVRLQDGRLVGDLSIEHGVLPVVAARHSLLKRSSLPRERRLEGAAVAVVNAYADNYYHWLLEVVPRLALMLRHAQEELASARFLLLNASLSPFQEQSLEWLGLADRVLPTRDGAFSVERLTVPSLAGVQIHPPPWACVYAREALIGLATSSGLDPGSQRLFLSRAGNSRRRIVNEERLLEALEPLRLKIIRPGELSLAEQVATFAGAELIIGAHGAELTNLLFAPAGATVLELFPGRAATPCYWLIARHQNLRYRWLSCDCVPAGEASANPADGDLHVDPEAILRSVADMLD